MGQCFLIKGILPYPGLFECLSFSVVTNREKWTISDLSPSISIDERDLSFLSSDSVKALPSLGESGDPAKIYSLHTSPFPTPQKRVYPIQIINGAEAEKP